MWPPGTAKAVNNVFKQGQFGLLSGQLTELIGDIGIAF